MKTRSIMLDHDLVYGRDIRIAGIMALMLVTVAFLFMPQPKVEPHRLHGPGDWTLTVENPVPVVYDPPKPAGLVPRTVPVASDNPEAPTIDSNTSFNELRPDVTAPTMEANIPFWRVERKPRLVSEVVPDYPEMARAAGIEGKVIVSMVVDTLGYVAGAEVYVTSGNVLLDRAAIDAAYKCGFKPGFQRDRPVVVHNVILPFNFRLH